MDITTISEMARSSWVVWLILLFAFIIFWALRPKNKKRFEEDAKMIFKDDEN
ncbi:MAG: cbb3-type cytochrome c oxidase subunit 3, partial [Rhodospirillaceae bacterium]|nr:cbb3-type cytochrome c oxidase subunit 3 [Rhodospirillaceae bacterium]